MGGGAQTHIAMEMFNVGLILSAFFLLSSQSSLLTKVNLWCSVHLGFLTFLFYHSMYISESRNFLKSYVGWLSG